MMALYAQAQSNTQSIFNFYLTFVTAVLGAIIFILQKAPADDDAVLRNETALMGVLFFTTIVGSTYLSAMSVRYAHAARYSFVVDEIRRYLIEHTGVTLPDIYKSLTRGQPEDKKAITWMFWLAPPGNYHMFIAMVNSAAWGTIIWLFLHLADVGLGRTALAALLTFALTFTIYNIYSHLVIKRFSKGVNVHRKYSRGWASRM